MTLKKCIAVWAYTDYIWLGIYLSSYSNHFKTRKSEHATAPFSRFAPEISYSWLDFLWRKMSCAILVHFDLNLRQLWTYSLLFNTSHGILIREKWDFPQILLFQPGLWVKVCCVYYCTLVLNLFFLLEGNDDVIVTSTEGCCVVYFNLVFE